MSYVLDGNVIETTDTGYLTDTADWSEELAKVVADAEGIELSERHWDVIRYLRSGYFDNNGNQPMERAIKKAMESQWGEKLSSKALYELFPAAPSKQGLKIAGLPGTTRK